MDMSSRIKQKRMEKGYTQEELAEKLGLQKSAIAKYENGRVENIKRSVIVKMSEVLECSPSYLMGWDSNVGAITNGNKAPKKGVEINVLGRVAAGVPIEVIEDIVDTEEISEGMAATGEFFGLQIDGNSMEPKMNKGDVVIVRQQDDAESGDTVIVTINGEDAMCKRLRKYRDGIELISTNPSYEPFFFSNKEIEDRPIKVIGKVVELRCKF